MATRSVTDLGKWRLVDPRIQVLEIGFATIYEEHSSAAAELREKIEAMPGRREQSQ